MKRREFLTTTAALVPGVLAGCARLGRQEGAAAMCRTYATPQDAMRSHREPLAYVVAVYRGTGRRLPDYLATVDVDPDSKTYSQVIHRLPMPTVGDELHHYGWNTCSSCYGQPGKYRRYLVVPGLVSGNIHIIDVIDPARPRHHKLITGKEIAEKVNLSFPHTVHCGPDGRIMISMLGDAKGNGPGGFLIIDADFKIAGRWEKNMEGVRYGYDFWYQPRRNAMVSSGWAAPKTVAQGFHLEHVKAGKYGQRLYFWDWTTRELVQTIDMGDGGRIPLEVRFHHDPDSNHGFAGATLSSAVWHWYKDGDRWAAHKVIQVEPAEAEGWDQPAPGLITDILLSLDDRWLYLSNWLHGDIRQYDVSDPAKPKLTGQVWLGGILGKSRTLRDRKLHAGPQMLQLSRDGRRLYATDSLFSVWDNQFYPDLGKHGSCMLQLDCDTTSGGLKLNERFLVDFGKEPGGPSRAHEIRFPGGDCTSDIWV
jgi:selenium-binding protein 1